MEAESRFETFLIEDDTTHRRYTPASEEAAVLSAERLIRRHHVVDLGLMQVNSANLAAVGLTPRTAFDPCFSLAAGGALLETQYRRSSQRRGEQVALREALSRYNTGNARRGFVNGYVHHVEVAARLVEPALASGAIALPAEITLPAEAHVGRAVRPARVRKQRHVTLRGT